MTRSARLRLRVAKEIRELAPAWLACLLAMAATAAGAVDAFRGLGIEMLGYFLGMSAIGALSIGHEYSHRTVSLLLSQPARRADLLLVKLGVLAAMLLTLRAVAGAVLFTPGGSLGGLGSVGSRPPEPEIVLAALWLPVLCGLFVAPWLTMLCRSSIAGTVFTMTLPGVFLPVGALLGIVKYGLAPASEPAVWEFQFAFLWRGTLALCAVAAVMSWRKFVRLEAIDGPGQDVRLPHWLVWRPTTRTAAPAFSKRHPLWLLAKKELRLQQMTLIVAGVYVLGWLTVTSVRTYFVTDLLGIFFVLTIFYNSLLVSLMIGSLASAEERQFGTLEWQVLLPMATWKQWALKVGVALGLAMLLALILPALLASLNSPAGVNFPLPRLAEIVRPRFTVPVAVLTVGSLYVSSLATSGLWALLVSLTAMSGALLLLGESSGSAVSVALVRSGLVPLVGVSWADQRFMRVLALLLAAGFLAIVLRFALANHRSADRAAGRVWQQVIWMAGCLAIGVILLAGVVALYRVA